MQGWIKLHRKLLMSNMYSSLNSKQRDVMFACLMMANHSPNEWEWCGDIYKCNTGEFISSLDKIKANCSNDVKIQSVRTALLKLEKWGFLTNKSTKTGRLITICKWGEYQDSNDTPNKGSNSELTKSQQRPNKDLTPNKNVNNGKNVNNEELLGDKPHAPKKSIQELCLEREVKFKANVLSFIEYDANTLNAFYNYWSEPNKSKSKMLWETKPTFEIKRRLATWASKSFNKNNNNGSFTTTETRTEQAERRHREKFAQLGTS